MAVYVFTADRYTIALTARTKVDAFKQANERFESVQLPAGMWEQKGSGKTSYRWAEGNFFD